MSETNGRLRVDANDLTLREHAEAMRAAEPYAEHPASADYVVAGMAWQIRCRTDPEFTYEQALELKLSEIELVGAGDDAGEVSAADSGGPAPLSAVPGESVPAP